MRFDIYLAGLEINKYEGIFIATILEEKSNLTTLNLCICPYLYILFIGGNILRDEGIKPIAESLKSNTILKSLDLSIYIYINSLNI